MTDVSDCQCIACGGRLKAELLGSDDATLEAAFACEACGKVYDQLWGVPFLLEYEEADFCGLVEIAANAQQTSPHSPDDLKAFNDALAGYHAAADRAAFAETVDLSHRPWLAIRYNEWVAVELLTQGEDFAGRKVLDVGAGFGFDAYRHVLAGADVTALEHNPVLAREGRQTLPMIRWIGGAAHRLPFADASFDAVFCNAALHHLRDIPRSMREMLRVLRPGGLLITSGDPFRADNADEASELEIFNAHPDVLLGVNEQVPRFRDFVAAPADVRSCVEPRLFTQALSNEADFGEARALDVLREWNFDTDRERLGALAGSLALKVRVLSTIAPLPPTSPPPRTLRAGKLASWLNSQAHAMAELAAWAPEGVINTPFPGEAPDRFELLNGWQAPTHDAWRQAYRRARWYLRRSAQQRYVRFVLENSAGGGFDILLNGETAQSVETQPHTPHPVVVDITRAPPDQAFALEIRLQSIPACFEQGIFRVRDRYMEGERVARRFDRWPLEARRTARAMMRRFKNALAPAVRRVKRWTRVGA